MLDIGDIALGRNARQLRLDTLVKLRWLAVIGQSAAVALVQFGLGFPLPFGACFAVISVSALLNVGLRVVYPVSHRLSDRAAASLLAYDILQLAVLLYLTGGLQNPFAILFLAPVLISATALPPQKTLILGAFAIACASGLAIWHLPLPWMPGEEFRLPFAYVAGIWISVLLGIAFIAAYAWRVADEARMLAEALAATELVLAREQHLSQLDGLAAAAAHELGTPLATIALVAKELDGLVHDDGQVREDIALLREQVARCRDILGKLASLASGDAGPLDVLTLRHLIEEVAGPQRPFGVPIRIALAGDGEPPSCRRNPGVLYGLANLVDNAVDFAREAVTIEAGWDAETVRLAIRDDGPGFQPLVLLRLGDPYVTTRGRDRRPEQAGGLGLGLFIAKTLLERSGASVTFANAAAPGTGAVVTVRWSREAFARPPALAADAPDTTNSRAGDESRLLAT